MFLALCECIDNLKKNKNVSISRIKSIFFSNSLQQIDYLALCIISIAFLSLRAMCLPMIIVEMHYFIVITGSTVFGLPMEINADLCSSHHVTHVPCKRLSCIAFFVGQAVLTRLNQASRISRLLSGINPWSGTNEGDILCDLAVIGTDDPIILGVTRDNKVKIWSARVITVIQMKW